MFSKKTVRDVDVEDKIILVRTDYNVPLVSIEAGELERDPVVVNPAGDQKQQIASDLRIQASLPTIKYLLEHKAAKIILMSHLGRPGGQRDKTLSLRVVAEKLAELLPGVAVNFVDEVSGPEVEMAVEDLPDGGILLLENLRFSPEEEANSEEYAREIVDSTHAELFVQDGFAVVHRAHASANQASLWSGRGGLRCWSLARERSQNPYRGRRSAGASFRSDYRWSEGFRQATSD